ncbi:MULTISPECIES: MFS transporter [Chitinophaga]|uniref:MFS transporter n=1 Tax=Chitinophaga TaxID=79328 RepID=UPI001CEE074B|nr:MULTISPECIES: MFS transporter [Chitinophaga]
MFAIYKKAYSGLSSSIWWLALVLLVNRTGSMVIPFMTVYLTQSLHFSIAEAGWVMACFGSGAVLGALAGGRLADKIGFYPIQFWSLLLNGISFMILGQMQTLTAICVTIFFQSLIGEAFRPANATAIAHYSTPENRTRSYALYRMAINLGFALGPALGGMLAAISYHLLFWVDGISCIAAAFLMRIVLPPVKVVHKEPKKEAAAPVTGGSAYADKYYLVFIFLVTLNAICFFQSMTIVPVFFKEQMQLNEFQIGLTMAVNGGLIALVEMILVYRLEGKRDNLFFIVRGTVMMGAAFACFNIFPPIGAVALLYMLLLTVGEMLSMPFMNSFWIARSQDHNRGEYAALYTICFSVAHIVAPTLGANLVQQLGFNNWWYITTGLCLLSTTGFILLRRSMNNVKIRATQLQASA